MKGFKVFTNDLRPPVRGGDPVWKGEMPFELPVVQLDQSDAECGEGWNFSKDVKTGLLIAGLWPNGRPSRVFKVEALGTVIKREDKIRTDKLAILSEVGEGTINDAIASFSKKAFGAFAEEMTQSQIAWRLALSRPNLDEGKIEECLREALDVRGLKDWKLKKYDTAKAAWAAKGAWAAWAAKAAKGAWAAWAAKGAWAATAAWDAWAALVVQFASKKKWVKYEPDYLSRGLRDAYFNGLEIALPTGDKELEWTAKP